MPESRRSKGMLSVEGNRVVSNTGQMAYSE